MNHDLNKELLLPQGTLKKFRKLPQEFSINEAISFPKSFENKGFWTTIYKIREFEIPKKPSFIILLIIFSIYIGFSIPELSIDESTEWPDYKTLADALEIWPDGESDNVYIQEQNDRYIRMFLLDSSLNIFQNIKILPFFASILVILFTYLLTAQITQKRFAGIISILVLIQSHTFLRFDTVAVYENFWVLFYLLSI